MSKQKTYRLFNKKEGKPFDATEAGMKMIMQDKTLSKDVELIGEIVDGKVVTSSAKEYIENTQTINIGKNGNTKQSESKPIRKEVPTDTGSGNESGEKGNTDNDKSTNNGGETEQENKDNDSSGEEKQSDEGQSDSSIGDKKESAESGGGTGSGNESGGGKSKSTGKDIATKLGTGKNTTTKSDKEKP